MNNNNGADDASIEDKDEAVIDPNDQDNDQDQEEETEEGEEETVESLRAKLEKEKQRADNQKVRAEKAEALAKQNGKGKPAPQKSNAKADELTAKDLYALMENKVAQEDIDEVVEYAKFKKISVADALKTDIVTRTLADKAEKRATAKATNVGGQRRGSSKVSDSTLLDKASKGEFPENDEDLDRLVKLRIEQKKAKK